MNFAEFLVGRVLFLNKKIASLAGYSAGSRLTMYIEDNASMRDGVMQLTLPCNLTDFAEMLGVGRASCTEPWTPWKRKERSPAADEIS